MIKLKIIKVRDQLNEQKAILIEDLNLQIDLLRSHLKYNL